MMHLRALAGLLLVYSAAFAIKVPDWMTELEYLVDFDFTSPNNSYIVSTKLAFQVNEARYGDDIVLDFVGSLSHPESVMIFMGSQRIGITPESDGKTLKISPNKGLQPGKYELFVINQVRFYNQRPIGIFKPSTKEVLIASNFFPDHAKEVFPCFNDPSALFKFEISVKLFTESNHLVWSNSGVCNLIQGVFSCRIDENLPLHAVSLLVGLPIAPVFPTASCWEKKLDSVPDQSILPWTKFFKASELQGTTISGYNIVYLSRDLLELEENLGVKEEFKQCVTLLESVLKMVYRSKIPPKTWADLWLTDSFAKFVAYEMFQRKLTGWEKTPFDRSDISEVALNSLESAPIIPNESDASKDVVHISNPIRTAKGAQLLRMFQTIMSTDMVDMINKFYLTKKGTAVSTDDFFEFLIHNGVIIPNNVDFKHKFKNRWLTQKGFPHLYIKQDDSGILVEQDNGEIKNDDNCWSIPLKYTGSKKVIWLLANEKCDSSIKLPLPTTPDIFNPESSGFYRVLYEENQLEDFKTALSFNINTYSSSSRSQLLSDVIAQAYSGNGDIFNFLSLVDFAKQEKSAQVWQVIVKEIKRMWSWMPQSKIVQDTFMGILEDLMLPIYQELTFGRHSKESVDSIYLRRIIIDAYCYSGISDCLTKAKDAFDKNMHTRDINMFEPIYCYGGLYPITTEAEWTKALKALYKPGDSRTMRKRALRILACPKVIPNEVVIKRYLQEILQKKDSLIKKDDIIPAMDAILSRHSHSYKAMDFFFYHFAEHKRLSREDKISIIKVIGSKISTEDQLDRVGKFIQDVNSSEDFQDVLRGVYNHATEKLSVINPLVSTVISKWDSTTTVEPTSTNKPTPKPTKPTKPTSPTGPTNGTETTDPSSPTASPTTTAKPGAANSIQAVNIPLILVTSAFLRWFSNEVL